MGLADELDVKCKESRRIKDHSEGFGLSNWKDELRGIHINGSILNVVVKFELSVGHLE